MNSEERKVSPGRQHEAGHTSCLAGTGEASAGGEVLGHPFRDVHKLQRFKQMPANRTCEKS